MVIQLKLSVKLISPGTENKHHMKNQKKVSFIVPTHTGLETIEQCLNGILNQANSKLSLETIIIIDGPNSELYEIVNKFKSKFIKNNFNFKSIMLEKNVGVFEAILSGVRVSKGDYIVLTGDRVVLPNNFITDVMLSEEKVVIPNVIEQYWDKSAINTTLYLLRKKLFIQDKNNELTYLTTDNFNKVSKGTGGLYIEKKLYLSACNKIVTKNTSKHISDDTKLLKELLDMGVKIVKSNKVTISYLGRIELKLQVRHIYNRGPKFINYYLRPGTRFFIPLVILLFSPLIILLSLIINVDLYLFWFAFGFIVIGMISLLLHETWKQVVTLIWTIPLIIFTFYLGLIKGIIVSLPYGKK